MTAPDVSVITAVRNGAPYLAEAVDSVLSQAGVRVEHIVVDDGSTDGTADVAAAYGDRIDFVRRPPLGASAALNFGAARARAPYLAFLDADDVYTPGRLARQVGVLRAHPDADMTFGAFVEFASGRAEAERGRWAVRTEPQQGYITGGVLMRTALYRRFGGLNEGLVLGWFVDFVVRARDAGAREVVTDDVVFRRRIHGANTTIVHGDMRRDYLAVARAAIARRRPGPAGAGTPP